VENRGADLERVLREEEEAAAGRGAEPGPAEQRAFIDIWDVSTRHGLLSTTSLSPPPRDAAPGIPWKAEKRSIRFVDES
jgi:hypothetical protein